MSTVSQQQYSNRPKCEVRGCDLQSSFHGFNKDLCWGCYSKWLTSFLASTAESNHPQLRLFK